MIELRFFEKIDEHGTLRRILQWRDAKYMPWKDVPVITMEQQEHDAQMARDDSDVRDYS